jgi:hypothetical protein
MMPVTTPRSRLERLEDEAAVRPWIKAPDQTACQVFYLPVSIFPLRMEEAQWIREFSNRLAQRLLRESELREEVFLQLSTATEDYAKEFKRYSQRSFHLLGYVRSPGKELTGIPDADTVSEDIRRTQKFDLARWTADYALWFQTKAAPEQRELFLGSGGMFSIFLPPDGKAQMPENPFPFTPKMRAAFPLFKTQDVDGFFASAFTVLDSFLENSKQIFGKGLDPEAYVEKIGFVLPRFDSTYLVQVGDEEAAAWFSCFDVYLGESSGEKGMLLAFRKDYRNTVEEVLESMRQDDIVYPLERNHRD